MKALREIGYKKTIKFVFFTLYQVFIDLSLFPPVRTFFLKIAGSKIGKDAIIHNIKLSNAYKKGYSNLIIGSYVFLGEEIMIDLSGKIELEDHATLSNRVTILTHANVGYRGHPLQKHFPKYIKNTKFKKGCFVGTGAIIMPGVIVGEGAVVGAGAVVTKSVADWTVVAGVPAKKIRKIKV